MQLVNDSVVMYDTMKDKKIGHAEVIEKFGVPPDKVIEVQALIGDSTDNVPGVPGIGVKTAAQLIGEYGDLETLLKRASEIKQDKRRQTLIDNADKAGCRKTRHARHQRSRRADRRPCRTSPSQAADRLPQGDGVQLVNVPRRRIGEHRRRRDRTGCDARDARRKVLSLAGRTARPNGPSQVRARAPRRRRPSPGRLRRPTLPQGER